MGLSKRLKRARLLVHLSQRELAEQLGVTQQAVSGWEAGTRRPDYEVLEQIATICRVSVAYLLGETPDPRPLDSRARELMDRQAMPVVPIPILGEIHAGDPIPADEQIIGWTAIPEHQAKGGAYFALRVNGDCMQGGQRPIHDGDVVIVRQQPDVEDGKIAVVLWPDVGEAQLRRIYRKDGMVVLGADNHRYPPEIVRRRQLTILGVVVGVQTTPAAASEV